MVTIRKIFIQLVRAMFYAAMVLLVLAAGGLMALQTEPVREKTIRFIEEAVAENTRAVCRIENLRGSLISRFEIAGLELKAADTGRLIFSAEKAMASYSIPMLLGRTVWINQLILDGVRVDLVENEEGSWNVDALAVRSQDAEELPAAPSDGSASEDYVVKIRKLLIREGDVSLTQPSEDGDCVHRFSGIECSARLDMGKKITADVRHLALQANLPELNIKDLSGRIRFEPDGNRLVFEDFRVVGAQSDFTLDGLVAIASVAPDIPVLDSIYLDLSADIAKMSMGEFGRTFPVVMPDADVVSGAIAVKGPVSAMDCRADLGMDQLHVKSHGRVTIDAAYDVGLDISGTITALDLSALPLLDLNFLPGRLNGDFSLFWQKIGAATQSGKILLDVADSELRGYGIDQADLNVRISGPDFVFDKLHFKTPFGRLDGTGELIGFMASERDNRIGLAADIENLKPNRLLSDTRFAGDVTGRIDFSMFVPQTFSSDELAADMEFRIKPSKIVGLDVSCGYGDVFFRNHQMTVQALEMETEIGAAEAAGTVSFSDDTCHVTVSGFLPAFTSVKSWAGAFFDLPDISGSMSMAGDITGHFRKPHVHATLKGRHIGFQGIEAEDLRLNAGWSGGFQNFNAIIEGRATRMRHQNIRIPEVKFKSTLTPQHIQADLAMTGEEIESLAVSGDIRNWRGPVREITLTKLTLRASDQRPIVSQKPVALHLSPDRIAIDELVLTSGSASLSVNGVVGMSPRDSLTAAISLKDLDIRQISGFFDLDESVHGRISADMAFSGTLASPIIEMSGNVASGGYGRWTVPGDASFLCTYEDREIKAGGSVFRDGETTLVLDGTAGAEVSFMPAGVHLVPDSLAAEVRADQMDVSRISDMLNHPEYGFSGKLNAVATLSGDVFRPNIQGQVWLGSGALDLKKQGLTYETVSADIRFSDDAVTIKNIKIAGDKEGHLLLSGRVSHDHFKPRTFDLRASGDGLYVPFHSGVDARIDPDLTLTGTWEAPVLAGNIRVPEGRVNLERFLKKKFSEIEIIAPVREENGMLKIPEKEPEPLGFVNPLAADVRLSIPKDFWFRGKDELIEIKGDVQLKKAPFKHFVLYGSVMPVRGTYRFRGRLFQITEGELIFTGQEDINPFVDVTARHVIDDVTIIISLSGTFENIRLVLSSEPAMDQASIISYLIFGRGPGELSDKESFQAAEAALSYTGQIAADKLRDLLGDSLGIDYLSIDAGSGGLRQGSLTMGKYVLPRVFVTFRQGFDETVTQKVEVTYEINKNFELETRIDNEQTSAVDLIWKFDY